MTNAFVPSDTQKTPAERKEEMDEKYMEFRIVAQAWRTFYVKPMCI